MRMKISGCMLVLTILVLHGLPGQAALPTPEEVYKNIASPGESEELKAMHMESIKKVLQELTKAGYTGNNGDGNTAKDFIPDKKNDESSSTKKLSDLSEFEIEQMVVEAVKKAERDTPLREMRSTRQATYQGRHYRRNYNPESAKKARQALIMEKVATKLTKDLGLSSDEVDTILTQLEKKNDLINYKRELECKVRPADCNQFPFTRFRSLNGTCNNLQSPCLGSAFTPFSRLLKAAYSDGIQQPPTTRNFVPLPNAREFSSLIFRDISRPSTKLTHIVMTWGQFIDHDLTLAEGQPSEICPTKRQECLIPEGECFGIPVPTNDPFRTKQSVKCLQVIRNAPVKGQSPREQINIITSFLDASQIYGSSDEELSNLRDGTSSRLLAVTGEGGGLLPKAEPGTFCRSDDPSRQCFRAGDERVNENLALMAMHTLFVREHNRIAKEFEVLTKGTWSQERIFRETRKIVGAITQHITYNEFLPEILSDRTRANFKINLLKFGRFVGYNPNVNPSITNSFATAAYRFGHSLVQNLFGRPGTSSVPTRDFYDPRPIFEGVDNIFLGLAEDPAQTFDSAFAKAITRFLELSDDVIIDLPAVNIQRGREHGIPSYVEFRRLCGLGNAATFNDLLPDFTFDNLARLFYLYGGQVRNIDLFPGGVLENPLSDGGILGPTFSCILGTQFRRLREGDRFWYESADPNPGFSDAQLTQLRKATLARVICDNNADITRIQARVMRRAECTTNKPVSCIALPKIDLSAWL